MTSRTHDIFAFASLITIATYYPPTSLNLTTVVTSSIGSIVGSLLPDIDQESNQLWDLLPAGHFAGGILRKLFIAHRTLSHSLIGIFLIYKILNFILPKILNPNFINIQIVFYSIMIGYLSHLILDSLTEEGLPLFFPLKFKIGFPPVKSLRMKTGSWFEKYVFFPMIIIYIIWFVGNHQQKITEIFKLALKK